MLALWYPWKSCKDRGVPFDVDSGGAVTVNSGGNEVCETVLLTAVWRSLTSLLLSKVYLHGRDTEIGVQS